MNNEHYKYCLFLFLIVNVYVLMTKEGQNMLQVTQNVNDYKNIKVIVVPTGTDWCILLTNW
jgi:hypothetical protein